VSARRPFARVALCASLTLAFLAMAPRDMAAQDTGLSKSELVRVVVSSDSPAQKLETVRNRCLSFEPTEGDWSDLRNLGASDELIAAAQQCARNARAVRVALSASRGTVRAGDTTMVTVDLSRGGSALAGQGLVLAGSGGPGAGTRYSRSTNASGRAFFSIPGGEQIGATRYTVSVAGANLQGSTRITITTVADVPALATIDPPFLELEAGETVPEITVSVRDRFGNPVDGVDLDLVAGTGGSAPVIATAATGTDGSASLTVTGETPADGVAWEVRGGETVLASLPVTVKSPTAALEAGAAAAPGAAVAGADGRTPPAAPATEAVDDAAVRAGLADLDAGDPVAAEASFRQALGVSPRRADAQKGLAESVLAQGRAEEAITWFEFATRQNPGDADAWDGLGRAFSADGRRDDAARAFARAQEIDPTREELATEIQDLGRPPGYVTGVLWGGSTSGNSDSGSLRRAAFDVSVSPAVALWGGWDRSLAPASPELVRGPDEWDGWYAGGGLSYGSGHRLQTAFEFGQRTQSFSPIDDSSTLGQNTYRLTQTIRFSEARRATELKFGGYMGRWYDTDDWIVFTRFKTPVSRQLSLVASGSYGETIGTNWVETGRHADKDGRLYAGVAWENEKGLLVQPQVGVGSVSSERSDDLSGTLLDLLLEAAIPISRGADVRGYVRHQSPPGSEAFTTFALGLGFKVGWAGG
jgi:tetratricopeptide (TPR) repeat protein